MTDEFFKKYVDTPILIDILFFWNEHPNAKFSLGVIAQTLDCTKKADVEKALESLVSDEIVEKHILKGLPFYCLSTEPQKREPILRLSECGLKGWLRMSPQSRRQRVFQLMLGLAVSEY